MGRYGCTFWEEHEPSSPLQPLDTSEPLTLAFLRRQGSQDSRCLLLLRFVDFVGAGSESFMGDDGSKGEEGHQHMLPRCSASGVRAFATVRVGRGVESL